MSYRKIRASDIADYVYCRRAWYLRRVRGDAPQNERALAAGRQYHAQHGRAVQQSFRTRRLAYVLLLLATAVIVFQVVLAR